MGAEENEELEDWSRRLIFGQNSPAVCVSIPVLGELLVILQEKDKKIRDDAIARLDKYLYVDNRLETFAFGLNNTNVFEMAAELRRDDTYIKPADAIIVACAFEDEGCKGLYIIDKEIIESSVVQEKAREKKRFVREPS